VEAWLQGKPREVAVMLAARAALRVLPILQATELNEFFLESFVLPAFHSLGISWAAARYPTYGTELAARAATATNEVIILGGDVTAPVAANYAANLAVRAAAADAAFDAVGIAADTAAQSTAAIVTFARFTSRAAFARSTARMAAAFWSAVSTDATRVELGTATSDIAGLPLWPKDQPEGLWSLWQKLKEALHADKQDWDVWTAWYEARLEGRVREEERELAYVRIDDELWDQGPAIVNAEIKRRIEALERSSKPETEQTLPSLPEPIEDIRSAISFGWTSKATISVIAGLENWPVFPFKGGEQDHHNRLETCRALARDIAQSLRSGRWNARVDYPESLDQYGAYLPAQPGEGNFLLADAEARIIRAMFAAETDILPIPLAAKLKVLLEQHIGLRAYYPATEEFYESVRSGHLEAPLPIDAVEGFIQSVRDDTPTLFEPNVVRSLEEVAQPVPRVLHGDVEAPPADEAQPVPPPDPLGEVDPEKAQRFTLGGAVNAFWKTFLNGEKIHNNVEGWEKAAVVLKPYVSALLEWLRSTL
jgi:hypothetical protein